MSDVIECSSYRFAFLSIGELASLTIRLAFYRPPALSIALMMILLASSPDRFVTVRCATDCRRRVFFFASTEISVICIATRGARRSIIVISRSFSLAKVSPPNKYLTCMSLLSTRQPIQSGRRPLPTMATTCLYYGEHIISMAKP